jgi:murein DD-endopeptidase MepM/ murein hydrolase activator NlpD
MRRSACNRYAPSLLAALIAVSAACGLLETKEKEPVVDEGATEDGTDPYGTDWVAGDDLLPAPNHEPEWGFASSPVDHAGSAPAAGSSPRSAAERDLQYPGYSEFGGSGDWGGSLPSVSSLDPRNPAHRQAYREIDKMEQDGEAARSGETADTSAGYAKGNFYIPVPRASRISRFIAVPAGKTRIDLKKMDPGSRGRRLYHDGIDFFAKTGTPITPAADGVVVFLVDKSDASNQHNHYYGKIVGVLHPQYEPKLLTAYSHNRNNSVRVGQKVVAGKTTLGEVGRTAVFRSGPHVHFEVRECATSNCVRNGSRSFFESFADVYRIDWEPVNPERPDLLGQLPDAPRRSI